MSAPNRRADNGRNARLDTVIENGDRLIEELACVGNVAPPRERGPRFLAGERCVDMTVGRGDDDAGMEGGNGGGPGCRPR
jgi:hypothetical protein